MNNVKPDHYLSDDVRHKYISELKKHNESWFSKLKLELKENYTGFYVFATFVLILAVFFKGIHELGAKGGWWDALWLIFLAGPAFGITTVVSDLIGGIQSYERELQRHSDEMLELLYNEMETKKREIETKRHLKKLVSQVIATVILVGIGIILFLSISSKQDNIIKRVWSNVTTNAKCSVVSKNATDDSFLVSGEPDYGITVSTTISNSGEDGNVFMRVKLSSSEGDLIRKRTIFMKAGSTKKLKYQFIEPTVNATNVEYSVSCTP